MHVQNERKRAAVAGRPSGTRLAGKRAVLIGAGQSPGLTVGFGRATAQLFADEGARVMVVDIDRASAEASAAAIRAGGGDAVVHIADHTSDEQCRELAMAAVEQLGGIDVLYDGVGISGGGASLVDTTPDTWDQLMNVNLKGMFLAVRQVVPVMIGQGSGGSIVLVSSLGAVGGLRGVASAYGVSKAGLNRLVRGLAAGYAAHNIRANAIMPGMIDTPMAIDAALADQTHPASRLTREQYVAQRDAAVPMAYKGTAMDVAYAALYFACDESRYVSGTALAVDGALSAS
jgi:NAD(P)-dependent dehydrogenase (short-subunit alcohol dehydrogenase family)